jgi:hypothetical protein
VTTITRFAAGLKERLRKLNPEDLAHYTIDGTGSTMTGQWGHTEVDWDLLDKEIDEFCATFQKGES